MNYYLLIYNHISGLVKAETPELAVVANMKGECWHARSGKVSGHYIAYEFYMTDGRATGREIDVVDLGAVMDNVDPCDQGSSANAHISWGYNPPPKEGVRPPKKPPPAPPKAQIHQEGGPHGVLQ